jgi:endonuclease/exonuclease/phosphatase family metal-dependent hydrolase
VSSQSHTNDLYTIKKTTGIPVARGFIDLDIAVTPAYSFRLLVAHLKSKVFHRLGQTEMRRNEARLLNNHIRAALADDPDAHLLVVGDLNDTYNSSAVRKVREWSSGRLHDLRPADPSGQVWTHYQRSSDTYTRIDYLLVSEGMLAEVSTGRVYIVGGRDVMDASDHRPLVAVFRAKEQ